MRRIRETVRGTRRLGRGWRWSAIAVALVLGSGAVVFAGGARCRALPGEDAPSAIVLAPSGEPGEALVVRGRVFAPDGETPVPGVVLYAYQTDATGRYARVPRRVPRLRGWVRTDAEGRYEYRTIRPGSYPGRRAAAHIHVQLWGAGYQPQYSTDLLFADDPFLSQAQRDRSLAAGRFAHVCDPERDSDGELHCTHHHRLKPRGDDLEPGIRHGLDLPAGEG